METRSFIASDGLELFYDVFGVENPEVVLQIVHGSVEHGQRYHEFAEYLQEKGIAVYVMDQRGHGRSVKSILGELSDTDDSWSYYVKEQYQLTEIIKQDYKDAKVFILGHSMGSFVVRDYLSYYSRDVDGALISGTGSSDPITISGGKMLAKSAMKNGRHIPNEKLHNLVFGPLNKKAAKMGIDSFISRDQSVIDAYNADPACYFTITPDYAYAMTQGLGRVIRNKAYDIDTIPLMFFSGELDPVGGNNLKYVKQTVRKYLRNGNKVDLYIYDDALHEMLNETNKEEVYEDIINWINKHK